MFALRATPIDQPFVAFGNRTPRGTITLPLFIEGVPEGGGSIYATRD